MKVVETPVADLIPYVSNARTHTDEQVAQIAASIKEFGFNNPVLTDGRKGIIAGHGRVLAARKLGMATVPTIPLEHLSEAQKKAYILADNKLALNAGWDNELLSLELGGLSEMGFDLSVIGFTDLELESIFAKKTQGLTDPDEVPEVPDEPISKMGDVWILGRHRLVCGDSTDADTVAKCLNGVEPHLMVTDPPYGVEYDAEWRKAALPDTNPGKTGGMHGKVSNDNQADWSGAWALFPGDVVYCWHAGVKSSDVQRAFGDCGFDVRAQIIWAKHQSVIGRGHYHVQHEPCFYLVRKGKTGHWLGGRKQHTLWQIDKPLNNETGHSTQKPVECMKRPIENNSSPGQAVYEPFSGSGTTIIAGEMTGRAIHAIELNPAYCDMAITRWQNFTGEQATREDGENFSRLTGDAA
jgi:DNA modification methylase